MKIKLFLIVLINIALSNLYAQKPGSINAVEFDGSDDYITVPDVSAMNPTTKITVEAWIKADAYSTTNFGNSIFCKHGWATGNKGYVLRCGDNGRLGFNISNASGTWVETFSAQIMKTGLWYHVAGTFNGDTVAVYINGNLEATTVYSGVMSPSTGLAAKIGDLAYTVGGSRLFKGQIDEVRVWNTALTKATIRDWMCRKVNKAHPNYSNLAVYYKLDEGNGIDAFDKSGNGNTATLINNPKWVSSGAALGDSSVHSYGGTSMDLVTKFGDIFTVKNFIGSPSVMQAYVNYDTAEQSASKNVLGAIDSTHFFAVYYVDNSAVKFDINYNYKNLSYLNAQKKCGVNMLVKQPGNKGTWDYMPLKIYDNGDSLSIKKQTKNEFVMALFQTDSSKLLSTSSGNNWFCGGDSLLLSVAANDSFNFAWYKNGNIINSKNKKTLWVSSIGTYKVKIIRRGTNCSFTSSGLLISSRSTKVSWSQGFTTCQNSDSIKLVSGTPSGGYFSGKFVTSNGYFHPLNAGVGTFSISYNFLDTNNCINKAFDNFILLDTTKLNLTPISQMCTGAKSLTLNNVTPSGGTYTGTNVSSGIFNSPKAGLGNHKVTYTFKNAQGCNSKSIFYILINKPDSISVSIKPNACAYDAQILVKTYPSGGTLKGGAVIGQNFYPLFATKGWQWIYYTIIDSHNCTVKDSAKIYISEIPKASIKPFKSICNNDNEVNLSGGQPTDSGQYLIKGLYAKTINPSAVGAGLHKIEYKVVNYFGCRDSASTFIRINASPLKPLITLFGNQLQSSAISGNQWLDQNGEINGETNQTISPTKSGYYWVKVTNDSNCTNLSDSIAFEKVGILSQVKNGLTIYPNPSKNGQITILGINEPIDITVSNLLSQTLLKLKAYKNPSFINLEELGKGTFYILINSANSRSIYRLVIF